MSLAAKPEWRCKLCDRSGRWPLRILAGERGPQPVCFACATLERAAGALRPWPEEQAAAAGERRSRRDNETTRQGDKETNASARS